MTTPATTTAIGRAIVKAEFKLNTVQILIIVRNCELRCGLRELMMISAQSLFTLLTNIINNIIIIIVTSHIALCRAAGPELGPAHGFHF